MATESQEQINTRLTQGVAANAASIALLSQMTAIVYKGVKATYADLPSTGNANGDLWYVQANHHCYLWNTSLATPAWEDAGAGVEGVSPTVSISEITGGHRISIYDVNHQSTPQTFDVLDGTDGDDGVSPSISVTAITGGHRVSIIDATHPASSPLTFDVMDGTITDLDNQPTSGSINAAKSGGIYSFVNSQIATNAANYISNNGSPFVSLAALQAYSGTVTNNDFAFVAGTDSSGNNYLDEYKATVVDSVVTWTLQFRLNNVSLDAGQWLAVQSGIRAAHVTKLAGIETGAEVNDISSILFNGSALAISNKTVTIPIVITSTTPSSPTAGTIYFITGS